MPNTVITTREVPIATVQLNRPDVLNALNEEVLGELVKELTALDDDDAIRCIVLTGNERAFAAGADIKEAFVTATPISIVNTEWGAGGPALQAATTSPSRAVRTRLTGTGRFFGLPISSNSGWMGILGWLFLLPSPHSPKRVSPPARRQGYNRTGCTKSI